MICDVLAFFAKNLMSDDALEAHGETVLPAWSTIKLVLAVAFWRAVERGELDPAKPYAWQPWQASAAPHESAGVLRGFRYAVKLTLADLLHLALAVSDNEATNVVLAYVGLEAVNGVAAELGLTKTRMQRRMMDAQARQEGRDNLTCARDLALLMEALARGAGAAPAAPDTPAPLSTFICQRVLWSLELTEHRDGLARYLPPETLYAGKLGDDMPEGRYCHEAALVRQADEAVVVVVMSDAGEGYEAVARTGLALYEALHTR